MKAGEKSGLSQLFVVYYSIMNVSYSESRCSLHILSQIYSVAFNGTRCVSGFRPVRHEHLTSQVFACIPRHQLEAIYCDYFDSRGKSLEP